MPHNCFGTPLCARGKTERERGAEGRTKIGGEKKMERRSVKFFTVVGKMEWAKFHNDRLAAAEQLILLPPEKASDRSSIELSLHRDGAMKIGLLVRRSEGTSSLLSLSRGGNVARVKFIVSTRVMGKVR